MQDSRRKLHEVSEALEPHSMHPADSATDQFDHDLALTLLAREENAITEINDAITRIVVGTYGVCLASGDRIPANRLRAIPWCRYSRDVESRLEKTGAVFRSSIPHLASVRSAQPQLPATGKQPLEGMEGEPDEEPEETWEAKQARRILTVPMRKTKQPNQ